MSCNSPDVPKYLHWDNKRIFSEADFLPEHHLYRITLDGNPIEFPLGTITAYSCKWSILINEVDLFKVDNPPIGNTFKFAIISTIKAFELKREKTDGSNLGWHKLTCRLMHKPNDCDYSHSEINIQHEIFQDQFETILLFHEIYTYEIWKADDAILQAGGSFYKNLRKDYRKDMIKLFYLPLIPLI